VIVLVFPFLRIPLDLVLAVIVVPAGLCLKLFRSLGGRRLPLTRDMLIRIGVFPIRNHYYDPLFDFRRLNRSPLEKRPLPGISLESASQLSLLRQLNVSTELLALDFTAGNNPHGFRLGNGAYESGDAEV
jgi:hypothetical protein